MLELDNIYNMDYREGFKMISDKSIDLVVTDPPYWHHKSGCINAKTGKPHKTGNSKFANSALYLSSGEMMQDLSMFGPERIEEFLNLLKPKMKLFDGYFFCSESQVPYYGLWADKNNLKFSILVWEKPLSIISKNRFSQNLEYIVRIYSLGTGLNKVDDNSYYNRVSHDKPMSGKSKSHPTQKPVSVMKRFIELSSNEGDLILDPFLGSGTTVLACMETGRRFLGFELSEEYFNQACDRIISQLEE